MKSPPFFTIITASLNSGATIERALTSIRSQTSADLEHIVIDGGSSDETSSILKKFDGSYDLIWVSEPDNGIAHALNKGLRRARGRYVIAIQADDYLLNKNTLELVYPLLEDEAFDIYAFRVLYDPPVKGKRIGKPIRMQWWHRFRNVFPHQGAFVRKELYDRIGIFDEELALSMDYDFFYRALKNGCSVRFEKMATTIVGGRGVTADDSLLSRRLKEEFHIQRTNEKNPLWRLSQQLFRGLYSPYKLEVLPGLRRVLSSRNRQ